MQKPILKICFMGSAQVGKTSLIRRLTRGIFSSRYLATHGVEITHVEPAGDSSNVLALWDMKGCDELTTISIRILEDAHSYVIVTDPTRSHTAKEAKLLSIQLTELAPATDIVHVITKLDLAESWQFTNDELQEAFPNAIYLSALTGEGMLEIFKEINQPKTNPIEQNDVFKLD